MRRKDRTEPEPPRRHSHDGPPVAIQHLDIWGSERGPDAYPQQRITRVLRRCLACSSAFVTVLDGTWTLEQVQEAEGTKIRITAVPE